METGTTTVEAFRFLDVRGPKPDDGKLEPTYVVTRRKLRFPLTDLEKKLLANDHDKNYIEGLEVIVKESNETGGLPKSGGYIDHLTEYESILARVSPPPEEVRKEIHDLFLKRSAGDSVEDYLSGPAQRCWDWFLYSVIVKSLGVLDVPPYEMSMLARAIRIAAALFDISSVEGTPAGGVVKIESDIRLYISASIHIARDLFDPKIVRDNSEKVPLTEVGSDAREMQDNLVRELVKLDLAASEIRAILMNRSAILQPTPTPTPTPTPPASTGEIPLGQAATDLVVSLPKVGLSTVTVDMLVTKFGGIENGTNIDDINIVSVLGSLGAELASTGSQLFGGSSQAAIATFANQHALLTKKMSVSGDLPHEVLRDLPLAIPAQIFHQPRQVKRTSGASVRPLGVGDLKVVKQNLLRYESGEVAHVENVLQGQSKERVHSVKQRTEETFTIEQERTSSSERDLQSTDRFEMKEESTSALMEKRQNETGVTVTASYGAVSISANTKFSDLSTSDQSQKLSRSFAREVIDRSVSKVQQRVREERIRKTTLDIEETNRYSLTADKQNVVGVYRWVDKVYWAQVYVYGKRLMLEFMVPEPATLYVHAQGRGAPDPAAISPPEPLAVSAHQLKRHNYASIAAKYGAEVPSPPPLARSMKFGGRTEKDSTATAIEIEDGFVGIAGGVSYAGFGPAGAVTMILLGTSVWDSRENNWYVRYFDENVIGDVPLMVSTSLKTFSAGARIVCVPSDAAFEKWQLDTYKAITAAFQLRQSEYQEYLDTRNKADTVITAGPDAVNRDIERRELQRACIEMLSEQHFTALGAIKNNATSGWPEIDLAAATPLGAYAAFFQQSFEWDQITYLFYPYYWSRQSEWGRQINANGGDMLFSRFLNAGYARVVVPVRPAHENDILYFLETGQIWGGTEPPILGDADFVSIIDEIKESLDAPDSGTPEGYPWQFRIPTSLIILDSQGKLPEWPVALPTPKVFIPSKETCGGVPYNFNQWKDGKSKADAIRALGYDIDSNGDQDEAISETRGVIRALQMRFNELGVASLLGQPLKVDGVLGPCTLRSLTYFEALREAGKWPGAV